VLIAATLAETTRTGSAAQPSLRRTWRAPASSVLAPRAAGAAHWPPPRHRRWLTPGRGASTAPRPWKPSSITW